MASKVIALTARSEAGKDYLADYLVKYHNYKRVSFSDQLKKKAHMLFPWVEEDYPPGLKNVVIEHPENVFNMSPRDVWRSIDSLRLTDPQIFCRPAMELVKELVDAGENVVITDIRKEVEYDAVYRNGYGIVRITAVKETEYEDEDIIDSFNADYTFLNRRHQGMAEWNKFLSDNGFIDVAWVNALEQMIDMQVNVSGTFSPLWLDNQPAPKLEDWRIAASAEYGEFLEEVAPLWKWWKPSDAIDKVKATEEFADYVMFSLSHIIASVRSVRAASDEILELAARIDASPGGWLQGEKTFTMLHNHCNFVMGASRHTDRVHALVFSIDIFCEVFDVSLNEFLAVYRKKCELNMERHKAGYQETGEKVGLERVEGLTMDNAKSTMFAAAEGDVHFCQ